MLSESHSDADDDDDTEAPDDNTQHQNDTSDDASTPTTVSADAAVDFCEVCLVARRDGDTRIALVPCGHQRLCESCANEVHKDATVLFAARLSTCCCVCTNLTYA